MNRRKIIPYSRVALYSFLLMFSIGFEQVALAQEDPKEVEMIKADVAKRIPSFELKKINYRPWDFYWAMGVGEMIPGLRTRMRVDYDSNGQWVESRQSIPRSAKNANDLIGDMVGEEMRESFRGADYIQSYHSDPYYLVSMKSGEVYCLNKKFKRMKSGPMHIKGILTKSVKKDIVSRLENVYILEGKKADEPNCYQYQVVFKTDIVDYQKGKIVYTEDGEWYYTRYYMNNYDFLPLNLMMYVADRGGLKNFGRLNYDKSKEGEYFSIEFKDGNVIKMNSDFEEIK
ncbi:hypothetical protein [Reichenbachiella versicolor]|uniref:hypothetical protein n=1 Tax=Reichenbachiella versicolor TaxID=1821036 RepID=UPI0013A56AAE|nr:hypothetical protein [Reichenbachiella versicolor]